MKVIVAPNLLTTYPEKSLFLAGGISDCRDWQTEMIQLLRKLDITIYNPRRENFPMDDPTAAEKQIKWEFIHLQRAEAILFWFPSDTLCPITLYELGFQVGKLLLENKPIFVGVDPQYKRRQDVEIQVGLVTKKIKIVYSLKDLATQVVEYF